MRLNKIIKICFISYREPFEVVLDNFSKAILAQTDYKIELLVNNNNNIDYYKFPIGRNITKIKLSNKINPRLRKFIFALKVVSFLRNNEYSIIHLDISCRYIGIIKLLSRSKAKIIFHILSYPVTNSKYVRLKKMVTIYLQCLLVDKVIVQSKEIKDRWIGIKHLKSAVVIPVGFDKKAFFPIKDSIKHRIKDKLNIKENKTIIVYSGVISKQRNLDNLILSMSIVYKSYKDINLLLIGDGKAVNDLKNYAKLFEIESLLKFTGHITHDKVVDYLGISDIAISFVPINESFNYNPPLKTYEYLACGLPTIATQTISNTNIIEDGVNGILVNDTPEDIAAAVIKLLANPEIGENLSQNARKSIIEFDYEFLSSKYMIPMYEDLLTR